MSTLAPIATWRPAMDAMRRWVNDSIDSDTTGLGTDANFTLSVIAAFAEQLPIGTGEPMPDDDRWRWQALGVLLGDVVSHTTGVSWMEVTDEFGTDPCLVVSEEPLVTLFPLTMLGKRAEAGERPDFAKITQLYEQCERTVQDGRPA